MTTHRGSRGVDAEITMLSDRCRAASPPPWSVWCEGRDGLGGTSIIKTGEGEDIEVSPATAEDLDLLAAARTAIPNIVDGLRGKGVAPTAEELKHLRELVASATPGPRYIGVYSSPPRTYPSVVLGGREIPITGATLADLIFMVTARDDVARLLDLLIDGK